MAFLGLPDKELMQAGAYAMSQGGHMAYMPKGGYGKAADAAIAKLQEAAAAAGEKNDGR